MVRDAIERASNAPDGRRGYRVDEGQVNALIQAARYLGKWWRNHKTVPYRPRSFQQFDLLGRWTTVVRGIAVAGYANELPLIKLDQTDILFAWYLRLENTRMVDEAEREEEQQHQLLPPPPQPQPQ